MSPVMPEDDHAVFFPVFFEMDLNGLVARGGNIFPDVIGLDGQLPVAAIDQHRQLISAGRPRSIVGPSIAARMVRR